MSTPRELCPCSLHVVVDSDDPPTGRAGDLATALHHRLTDVTVLVAAPEGAGIGPYRRAMALADRLEAACGRRPRCLEVTGPLDGALAEVTSATGHHIVAVTAAASRRTVRAVRRAAAWSGAHVAVLPSEEARP